MLRLEGVEFSQAPMRNTSAVKTSRNRISTGSGEGRQSISGVATIVSYLHDTLNCALWCVS